MTQVERCICPVKFKCARALLDKLRAGAPHPGACHVTVYGAACQRQRSWLCLQHVISQVQALICRIIPRACMVHLLNPRKTLRQLVSLQMDPAATQPISPSQLAIRLQD